jgi:hypothetical protein
MEVIFASKWTGFILKQLREDHRPQTADRRRYAMTAVSNNTVISAL